MIGLNSIYTEDFLLLEQLFKINAPSKKEDAMKRFIRDFCKENNIKCKKDVKGNLYLKKGKGVRPCLVAHMDNVFSGKATIVPMSPDGDTIIGYDLKKKEQCGLGADDKVGIFIALKALLKYDNLKVLFTVEEEIGCLGSAEVNHDFFSDVSFVLQSDRKGYGDFVTLADTPRYDEVELCSDEFIDLCDPIIAPYKFEAAIGGSTDVVRLKEKGLDICVANISSGYYNPHYETEYVSAKEVSCVMHMVFELIEKLPAKKFEHKAVLKSKYKYNYGGRGKTVRYHSLQVICSEVQSIKKEFKLSHIHDAYEYMV